MVKYLLATIFVLMGFSCEKTVTDPSNKGSLSGKIVYRSEVSAAARKLENIKIAVSGTSLHAYTDSTGSYQLFDVPAGTYYLQALKEWPGTPFVLGRIQGVAVTQGQLTEVPDIMCTTDTTHTQIDLTKYFGGIEGTVQVGNYPEGIQYDYGTLVVKIPGTSFYADVDSSGHYMILNLPEGSYNLQATELGADPWEEPLASLHNIEVNAGELTTAQEIVFYIPYLSESFANVILADTSNNSRYSLSHESPIKVFKGHVVLMGELSYYRTCEDTSISIYFNGTVTVINSTKGLFYYPMTLEQPVNTIKVWVGEGAEPAKNITRAEIYYYSNPSEIYPRLSWYGSNPTGDFDVRLINSSIDDTCWYNNPEPDWGYPNIYWDNPHLDWDSPGIYLGGDGSESLHIENAPPGHYRIEVEYFSNFTHPENKTTPNIYVRTSLGEYDYSSPQPMAVGDVWRVVEIEVAQDGKMTVSPLNTVTSLPKSAVALNKIATKSVYATRR